MLRVPHLLYVLLRFTSSSEWWSSSELSNQVATFACTGILARIVKEITLF